MKEVQFENITLTEGDNPNSFFEMCIKNNLFKEDSETFSSRLKNIYENKKQYFGISAVLAKIDNKPIGICLLEHYQNKNNEVVKTQGGLLHLDNRKRKNPWAKKFDFYFLHAGFISIYIKEEYRRNGLAKKMVSKMELLQNERFSKNNKINLDIADHFIMITARGAAYNIVEQSKMFNPTSFEINDLNYNSVISTLSYLSVFEDKNEKIIRGKIVEKKIRSNKKVII
jgi:GNAT superfamily N-acetyltransferase